MKQLAIISAFWMAFWAFSIQPAQSQIIVVKKPARPAVIVKPRTCGPGKVWIAGHWQWNRRARKYNWVQGTCVRNRPGRVWVPGHWKTVPRGHKWVPGHWRR